MFVACFSIIYDSFEDLKGIKRLLKKYQYLNKYLIFELSRFKNLNLPWM